MTFCFCPRFLVMVAAALKMMASIAVVLDHHSVNGFMVPSNSITATRRNIKSLQPHHGPTFTRPFSWSALIHSTTNRNDETTISSSSSSSTSNNQLPYNWQDQWYALTYASYVPNPSQSAENVPAAVFGHPLVLWRSTDHGPIHCADDVCPHRRAALSEGRVRDGKLECYYHGWQFDGAGNKGSCTFIPQLATGATIPKKACLQMRPCEIMEGIVWVWMGDSSPNTPPPSQNDHLDPVTGKRDGFFLNDFQIDLPYDHSYLVENLIDPAHIPISHDRTPGGGRREKAEAYDMVVDQDSISSQGFTGRYRLESQQQKGDPYIEVKYEAPGIIRQTGFPMGLNSTIQFGAALHCMPLSLGRSRLLFRAYFGGLPPILAAIIASKPAFLRNLNSCKILEQDAGLITTQEDYFKRSPDRRLKDDFLMLNSADVFVKTYRAWLDQVGHGMPWFQGLASRSHNVDDHLSGYIAPPALDPMFHRAGNYLETRYHRHVMHCPETRNALHRIQKLKKLALGLAVLSISVSCGVAPCSASSNAGWAKKCLKVLVPLIPMSSLAAALLHRLEQKFFVSFKRKEQMRTEAGI